MSSREINLIKRMILNINRINNVMDEFIFDFFDQISKTFILDAMSSIINPTRDVMNIQKDVVFMTTDLEVYILLLYIKKIIF